MKRRKNKLEWLAFIYDANRKEIMPRNIFSSNGFRESVEKDLEKYYTKEEFLNHLQDHLFHYFFGREKYEILISSLCGNSKTESVKLDVYTQVMIHFNTFLDYVWSYKEFR